MTDQRSEKRDSMPRIHDAHPAGGRSRDARASDKGAGVQATGGDKGSKKTNDYETSGRDRNADKGAHNPENLGREGMDNEKVSRVSESERNTRGAANETGDPERDTNGTSRERHTEAARDVDNETEAQPGIGKVNRQRPHSAPTPGPDDKDDKKPRKVSKGEKGSRKPGTELTAQERKAANDGPDQGADRKAQGAGTEGANRNRNNEKEARADNDKQKKTQADNEHGTRPEKEKGSRSAERAGRASHRGGQTAAHSAG